MTLNQRTDYDDKTAGQGSKVFSLKLASAFVTCIQQLLQPLLASCEKYDSKFKLGGAPTVELTNGKLAIAPDLKCKTKAGNVFWIEVKDKAQRFYHPDTGADLFQVHGWYSINKHFNEPVYVLFKDPAYNSCMPSNPPAHKVPEFKARWEVFNGQPYGAWLSNLLHLNAGYPRIFLEHSRLLEMYILYFRVSLMQSTNWTVIIAAVDAHTIPPVTGEMQAFYHNDTALKNEQQIRAMIQSLFS